MILAAAIGLSVLVLASMVQSAPCGTFQVQCGTYYNGSYIGGVNDTYLGHLQFDGLYAGNYSWLRTIFTNTSSCSTFPALHIEMYGSWINMGDVSPLGANPIVSNLYMTASNLTVLAGSAAAAAYLNQACICGSTPWIPYQARVISSCPAGTCKDTTWLGGTPSTLLGSDGYIPGNPFYATVTSPIWGTSGNLLISYIDSVPKIGWNNDLPSTGNDYSGSTCITPTTAQSICGSWTEYCSPSAYANSLNFQSISAQFQYEGPVPTSPYQILTGDSGTYTLTEQLWIDNDCTSPYMTISQQGALAYVATQSAAANYIFQRNTPNIQITPITPGAQKYLSNNCPCVSPTTQIHQNWTVGATVSLTSCPMNDCNTTVLFHGAAIGQANWGAFQLYNSSSFAQLQFTELTPIGANVPTNFTNQDYPFVDDNSCTFRLSTNRWCGTYARTCTASVSGDGYDFTEQLIFDSPNSKGAGVVTRHYQLFEAATFCGNYAASFTVQQNYQVGAAASISLGGYNFAVSTFYFAAIPQTQSIVDQLNANCACGGTWSNNVFRVITGCKTCNVPFIGHWELSSQTRYTNILVYPDSLRYGNWSNVSSVGYATPLSIYNFPLLKTSDECSPSPNNAASKFPGGGVFLILLFVPLFIYFVVGALLAKKNTGAFGLPHQTFWSSLPGLIQSGFKFTFVEFFGLRSVSSAGYTAHTDKPEGYGTLGN